jgi:hypothetical protein
MDFVRPELPIGGCQYASHTHTISVIFTVS